MDYITNGIGKLRGRDPITRLFARGAERRGVVTKPLWRWPGASANTSPSPVGTQRPPPFLVRILSEYQDVHKTAGVERYQVLILAVVFVLTSLHASPLYRPVIIA